jgi:hypothetical protein
MLWELIARIFSRGDDTKYRGVGNRREQKRENKRERHEPWGVSRKIMGFNKNPAYITVDLRSFTRLLLLLLIVSWPLPLYYGTHMQATCWDHADASWVWIEMIHVRQKVPLSIIMSKFNLTRSMHDLKSNKIYLYSKGTNFNLDHIIR